MRTTVATLGGIVMLFVGFIGLNQMATGTQDIAVTNGTNQSSAAWNMTTGIVDGIGQAGGGAIVFMGVAAVIVISLGYLVVAGSSGR